MDAQGLTNLSNVAKDEVKDFLNEQFAANEKNPVEAGSKFVGATGLPRRELEVPIEIKKVQLLPPPPKVCLEKPMFGGVVMFPPYSRRKD